MCREVTLRMPIPLDRMAEMSPAYPANRAVNAVLYVCAATPGIQSTMGLPADRHDTGMRSQFL